MVSRMVVELSRSKRRESHSDRESGHGLLVQNVRSATRVNRAATVYYPIQLAILGFRHGPFSKGSVIEFPSLTLRSGLATSGRTHITGRIK
jgi:hypothetical protein